MLYSINPNKIKDMQDMRMFSHHLGFAFKNIFKTDISWWIFALSGVAVFLILTLFILLQTWKAASANPADIIKTE